MERWRRDILTLAMRTFKTYQWPEGYPRQLRYDSWKQRMLSVVRLLSIYLPSLFGKRVLLCEACFHLYLEDANNDEVVNPEHKYPGSIMLPFCGACGPEVGRPA